MKSLRIFEIYLNTKKKFQGKLWEYEKTRVNVTQWSCFSPLSGGMWKCSLLF